MRRPDVDVEDGDLFGPEDSRVSWVCPAMDTILVGEDGAVEPVAVMDFCTASMSPGFRCWSGRMVSISTR